MVVGGLAKGDWLLPESDLVAVVDDFGRCHTRLVRHLGRGFENEATEERDA